MPDGYNIADPTERDQKELSVPSTRKLFQAHMPEAIKGLEKELREFGTAFLRSRYAGQ